MKAAVFSMPKRVKCEDVPDAKIEHPRDALVRVTSTAICGSDLHIYNGLMPQIGKQTLGHEFMGIIEDVGTEVTNLKKGDRVVVPFPIACGECFNCRHQVPVGCENSNPEKYGVRGDIMKNKGGGLFGYTDLYGGYAGGQAEAVRVPYADYGCRVVPEALSDDQALFLTDILPTGWAGAEWAHVSPGETVAVFGCGPVGLMAMKSARYRGAERVIGIDVVPYRLRMAEQACGAETVVANDGDIVETLIEMTGGHGPDVCIDAVGMEPDRGVGAMAKAALHMERGSMKVLDQAIHSVRRGGRVSILGVYGTSYDNFPLGQWMDKGIQITAGQAPVHNYIDALMPLVADGMIVTDDIITHHLTLDEVDKGYDMFNKKKDDCVKVVMRP
ncbi:MAG: glutathione-dependent formaldehyde dehydrogenase [Proteobacteria bacterium]|nr:glutathione-dependent formaldehyde dehydrogenase [Pseudomonadota bacterium]